MGKVTVVYNHIPKIIKAMPREVDKAVDDTAKSIGEMIRITAWRRTGVAITTTKAVTNGPRMHSRVGIGIPRGRGFYVVFQEFGAYNTWKGERLGPDPRVAPAAHQHEPVLRDETIRAVRRAVKVT